MKRLVTNPLAPHNKKEAKKWAQKVGTLKTLYLVKNISVLFVKVLKMELAKCSKSRLYKGGCDVKAEPPRLWKTEPQRLYSGSLFPYNELWEYSKERPPVQESPLTPSCE